MKLSHFAYKLSPLSLIAQYPTKVRSDARLLVVDRKTGNMETKKVVSLLDYFEEKDTLVVNNSRIFPAKVEGRKEKTHDTVHVFLQRELVPTQYLWDTIIDPARKIRSGNKLYFGKSDEIMAEVVDNTNSRGRTIKFFWDGSYEDFRVKIREIGMLPLPEYIQRKNDKPDKTDLERYHSIFARQEGAVIDDGASLHFDERLVRLFEIQDTRFAEITVHNSLSCSRAIEVEDIAKAKMESDYFAIDERNANIINKTKLGGKRVCAVGVMVLRALESSYDTNALIVAQQNWTHLNIYPPFAFQVANCLLTNFHPSQTYPFIATCTFGGLELVMAAYEKAIKEKFRFFIYGDALLIL